MAEGISIFQKLKWRGEVLAYDFLRLLLCWLPIDAISWLGGAVLKLIGPLTSKQHIVLTGLRTAFPDWDEAKIKATAKAQWENTGRTFAEFMFIGRLRMGERVTLSGQEHFKALIDSGQAAVMVGGHFANWEMLNVALAHSGLKMRITYRPLNNPYFDAKIRKQRADFGVDLMTAKSGPRGAKELMVALKDGWSVGIMNDQKFNEGIAVDFFGHPAMTAPGPTRLALNTGAAFVPMNVVRTRGARFHATVYPPIKLSTTGDRHAKIRKGTEDITAVIEGWITAHPDQWFWSHRRWDKSHYKKEPKL